MSGVSVAGKYGVRVSPCDVVILRQVALWSVDVDICQAIVCHAHLLTVRGGWPTIAHEA